MSDIAYMAASATDTSRHTTIDGLAHQIDLWTDETPQAKLALVGPLGCGKTLALAVKCARLAWLNRESAGMLVVPTYPLARMVHIPEWPAIMGTMGVPLRFLHQESAFTWPWGHKTWLRTAERPARLAGPNLAYVLFDEPGQMDREAWDRGSIRVRDPKAKCRQTVLGGTPEGINWFADLFAAPNTKAGYRTIWGNEWHPSMAHYPAELVHTYGYDESLLAAYAKGQFVPLRTGRAYRPFLRATHLRTSTPKNPFQYSPELGLILGCDFNIDTMRWEVAQMTPHEIRFIDEIALGHGGNTAQAAREFCRRYERRKETHLTIVGDASASARSTSGMTDYQIIKEELHNNGWNNVTYTIPAANPRHKDRVDNTNYHLSGRGRTVYVSHKCKELALDWERVAWKKGQPELDKSDPQRTHASDAADYIIWMLARANAIGQKSHAVVRDKDFQGGVATMEF